MQALAILLLVALLALLAARVWVALKGRHRAAQTVIPPYTAARALLKDEERAYLKVLQQVLGDNSVVFPKVSLGHILEFPGGGQDEVAHWLRVQRRSVDFLVCDRELAPTLAVKLKPNGRWRRRPQDPLADSLLTANIPLLRVRSAPSYDRDDVAYRVKLALARCDSELGDDGSITKEFDMCDDDFEDSRLSSLWRWTSELWTTTRRIG
jgi:hypothetical protein